MTLPLVSCVVPVYNGERFLAAALDSVLAQTYRPIEVIVVDDGSTDETADVIERFQARDPARPAAPADRVRYIRQANQGAPSARNRGILSSAGSFIAFLDADDLWLADKLSRQMARFEARPELDVSVALAVNFWEDELAAERERLREHARSRPIPGYVSGTMLVRRAAFERVGLFDQGLRHADDTEWFLRLGERGGVVELLEEVLLRRRMHAGNLSRAATAASHEEYLRFLKAKLDRRRAAPPPGE